MKRGTATVSADELRHAVSSDLAEKVVPREALVGSVLPPIAVPD